MNVEQNHIIEKVFFEVNISNIESANSIKNSINKFLKNELFPRLELLFDEFNSVETVVRFDKLNINISVDDIDNLENVKFKIYNELEKRFKQQLNSNLNLDSSSLNPGKSTIQRISRSKDLETTFIFFLENGYLPWYGKQEYIVEFTRNMNWKISLNDKVFISRLNKVLQNKEDVVERFILQFPIEVAFLFLEKINYLIEKNRRKVIKIFTVLKDNLQVLFLRFLINVSLFDEKEKWLPALKNLYLTISQNEKQLNRFAGFPFVSGFKEVIEKIVLEKGIADFKALEIQLNSTNEAKSNLVSENTKFQQKNKKYKPRFIENETTEIAIKNAGLIILHPFFNKYFEKLDLLADNGWIKMDKLDVAVQSLHYLATGDENFFEGNLIFEKYLCGVLLKKPIPIESQLTENIKAETIILLKEAIKSWPALKNTSPDGLRQMFIHREGKLYKKENSCKLIVERKAQDILLERLYWNISIVKFPWNKELLFVEW
ncbi:MAG: hypothetical protein KAH68_02045 [Draconibacterium sp.]|nr:hypothetical protein [Draconibacterium sp.]